jgi:hypothetical protein
LTTLKKVNDLLATKDLGKINHFYNATMPYSEKRLLVNTRKNRVLIDLDKMEILWSQPVNAKAQNQNWNKNSRSLAFTIGNNLYVTTADGSYGTKGFVTDVLKNTQYSYFYTCGPMPMFKAIESVANTSGQYSFEERMGCGFGACMGCSCKTKYGNKRICREGPVLEREEIIW